MKPAITANSDHLAYVYTLPVNEPDVIGRSSSIGLPKRPPHSCGHPSISSTQTSWPSISMGHHT